MQTQKFFYFDHCGTTPIADPIRKTMVEFIESSNFGNPAAVHHVAGKAASEVVERARDQVAASFNCSRDGVLFTGGASESNNIVINGFWLRNQERGCRILVNPTEHKSVFETCCVLEGRPGVEIVKLKVLPNATIDLEFLESELKKSNGKPTLVAAMYCNNEVPARNPVESIGQLCEKYGAHFLCDAVQGVVREKIDIDKLGASAVVWTPHKIYGPKGVGVLLINQCENLLRLNAPYRGGEQEKGMRPGTLNTLGILGAGLAAQLHDERRADLVDHLRKSEQIFVDMMSAADIGFKLTVPLSKGCPGIVNFYMENVDAPSFLQDAGPVCVNRGASCTGAGGEKLSHVPKSLGLPVEIAANVIRASFGFAASLDDVRTGTSLLIETARRVRRGKTNSSQASTTTPRMGDLR
jgi:cysteine desulfurase